MIGERLRLATWPLTFKIPLLVAGLMVAVALVMSNVVLNRLQADQEANLRLLADSYLDGLATAVLPHVIRRDVWETFDTLDLARAQQAGLRARHTVVTLKDGSVLAASDPRAFATGSRLPADLVGRYAGGAAFVVDDRKGLAWARRPLRQEGIDLGAVVAEIDIRNLLAVRREVLITLILVNGGLAVLFGAIGYLLVRRMVKPIALLTEYVDRVRDGALDPIPARHLDDRHTEIGRLFASFNAMAAALRERAALAARLAKEEKIAVLGKLASGMAHEVNNPLGGMLNVVDTLKKHGHDTAVRERSLSLLERGLKGIAGVVRATLATYKGTSHPSRLQDRDLDDLKFLLQHEIGRRRLRLAWQNSLIGTCDVDGAAVRQVTLNLLLNACAASPVEGTVDFAARREADRLVITVKDRGPGLPAKIARLYQNPGEVSAAPSEDIGLGVWTVCHLLARLGGWIDVATGSGGTILDIVVPLDQGARFHAVA